MNENENNFESLRRLLALKRHETPPPGYFEDFSAEVRARIRAERRSAAEGRAVGLPWFFRLVSAFEAKPAFAGAFASALCMFLLLGIVYAERPDVTLLPLQQIAQVDPPLTVPTSPTSVALNTMPTVQPASISLSSTNPVFNAQPVASLFASQEATMQPVNFTFPAN